MIGPPALVALDWGTTSLRAYALAADGRVLAERETAEGILAVPDGGFDGVFEAALAALGDPDVPALASGMIGSRQGWVEAPYCPCPAGLDEIAARLLPVATRSGRRLWLVPGLSRVDDDGVPDVMRGEETQLLGAAERAGLFVLPGTHSKWASLRDGRIEWFATFMTGELFAALRDHTILGRLMSGGAHDAGAFARGLDTGGGLLHRLFSARTLGLFGEVPAAGLASYLSGLLIGAEIAEAKAGQRRVTILGSSALTPIYTDALRHRGFDPVPGPTNAAAIGLHRIAQAARLL